MGGGFKGGVFLIWTCPSSFVPFCPIWDFPDISWIFPIDPFPLSRPVNLKKSSYKARKGSRHNQDLKVGNSPGLPSLIINVKMIQI